MAVHPWEEQRPLSSWLPGGASEKLAGKVSRNLRPVIDRERCRQCLLCWLYCPDGAISRGEFYTIDYTFCKGCGLCAKECPHTAITMIREG